MIEFYSQKNFYFKVTSPDVKSTKTIFTKNIISFSIKEELRRMSVGSITLHDPDLVYSKMIRAGAQLNIEWGYREPPFGLRNLAGKINALGDEAYGAAARTNFKATVQHPSGGGSGDGSTRYNINFFGREYLNGKSYKVHNVTNRFQVISNAMDDLGISSKNKFIDFKKGSETLSSNTQTLQRETSFRFLLRLAGEWRAVFRIGYNAEGETVGLFLDYAKLENPDYLSALSVISGGSHVLFDYKKPNGNVLEYTWKQNAGTQGGGDNVRIVMGANGKPQFFRYVAERETVKVYRLVPERIEADLRKEKGFLGKADKLADWLNVSDFKAIRKYFDEVEQSTAPQGYGYEITLKTIGNPLLTAPVTAVFGSGFPAMLTRDTKQKNPNFFYVNAVEHLIDTSGYYNQISVMDALSITGGSYV